MDGWIDTQLLLVTFLTVGSDLSAIYEKYFFSFTFVGRGKQFSEL